MEFEEMKNLWENQSQTLDLKHHTLSYVRSLALKKQTKIFQISEVIGLVIAYLLAGMLVYHFIGLDHWFLKFCDIFLIVYLLVMPIYTLSVIRKLRQPDLINSNYKEIIDHFHFAQRKLKIAERISLVASPFLFIASVIIIAKIFSNKDVFDLNINFQNVFFLVLTFTGAVILNIWAFRKRKDHLKTITQTLEK
jgi:MFS family permease